MLVAQKHIGRVGFGATSPQLFRADDGKVYVVKLQNNRLGPKVLANELLGSRFAAKLGLCFPPGDIIRLGEDIIRGSRRLTGAGVAPGRHFACLFLSHATYVTRSNLHLANNVSELAGVMLLDHMLHNLDRTLNRRNLLLRREGDGHRVYAIDNSHLFRRGVWTVELLAKLAPAMSVNRHRAYGWLLKHYFTAEVFGPHLERVRSLTDAWLTETVAALPLEWLPHEGERAALLSFLIRRRDMAGEIVTCLQALIPDKHRGSNHN